MIGSFLDRYDLESFAFLDFLFSSIACPLMAPKSNFSVILCYSQTLSKSAKVSNFQMIKFEFIQIFPILVVLE